MADSKSRDKVPFSADVLVVDVIIEEDISSNRISASMKSLEERKCMSWRHYITWWYMKQSISVYYFRRWALWRHFHLINDVLWRFGFNSNKQCWYINNFEDFRSYFLNLMTFLCIWTQQFLYVLIRTLLKGRYRQWTR